MAIYINSYLPLQHTKFGRETTKKYPNLHPLEDGSIRREPDFKNKYPGISGLCRPGAMKTINLSPGDIIVYKTTGSHILTAILEVKEKLENHEVAYSWYSYNNLSVPSNCVLEDHLGIEKSHARDFLKEVKYLPKIKKSIERRWDCHYQKRAKNVPYFFITKAVFNEVTSNEVNPTNYIKIERVLRSYFNGKLPITRKTPAKLPFDCYQEILSLINNKIIDQN